jgi:trehalose 6-phosphate synthase/phosphatase
MDYGGLGGSAAMYDIYRSPESYQQEQFFTQCEFRVLWPGLEKNYTVAILGSDAALGGWVPNSVVHMTNVLVNGKRSPFWYTPQKVHLPLRHKVEYKYVALEDGQLRRWESIGRSRVLVPQGADLIVEDDDGMLRKYVPQKNSAINNLPVVYEEGSYPSGSPPDGAIDMSSAGGSASQMPSLIGDDAPDSPTSELPNSSAGRSLNNLAGGYPSGNRIREGTEAGSTHRGSTNTVATDGAASSSKKASKEIRGKDIDKDIAGHVAKKLQTLRERDDTVQSTLKDTSTIVITVISPVHIEKDSETGKWKAFPAQYCRLGPLYAVRHKISQKIKFVGFPNAFVPEAEQQEVIELLDPFDCVPVFVEESDWKVYGSFCATFLRPIFHNMSFKFLEINEMPYSNDLWSVFKKVNSLFASAAVEKCKDLTQNPLFWAHDYGMLMVPQMISQKRKRSSVGLFMHSPFPVSAVFSTVPCREEMLVAMMHCDLIGFQFFDYTRHFMSCCKRLFHLDYHFEIGGFLGIDVPPRIVWCKEKRSHSTMLRASHVCISDEYFQNVNIDQVENVKRKYRKRWGTWTTKDGERVPLVSFGGIDRFDMMAGLHIKLKAFSEFLENYKKYRGKICLVQQVYYPVRTNKQTEELKDYCKRKVQYINDTFGAGHVHWIEQDVTPMESMAMLGAIDILVDTTISDGFNMVPFEFYASHGQNLEGSFPSSPACIVSEFSGCNRALMGAFRINPWNIRGMQEVFDKVMSMKHNERMERFMLDFTYIQQRKVENWAEQFLCDLQGTKKDDFYFGPMGFGTDFSVVNMAAGFRRLEKEEVVRGYPKTKSRVFLLDYEGTLQTEEFGFDSVLDMPEYENIMVRLSSSADPPSKSILDCLKNLCSDMKNVVVILSGRDQSVLEKWFGQIDGLWLCAEHGFYHRYPRSTEWVKPFGTMKDSRWRTITRELMTMTCKRTQGSFLQEKASLISWQYRDADPEFGQQQSKVLCETLGELLADHPVQITTGKGYVEVRTEGVNKGTSVMHVLDQLYKRDNFQTGDQSVPATQRGMEFVVCIGDDRSDESMYESVHRAAESSKYRKSINCNEFIFTCTVGRKPSCARHYVDSVYDVADLLVALKDVVPRQKRVDSMPALSAMANMAINDDSNPDLLTGGSSTDRPIGSRSGLPGGQCTSNDFLSD